MQNKGLDDLEINNLVTYQDQLCTIVDHYGNGNYAVLIGEDWFPAKRSELTKEN